MEGLNLAQFETMGNHCLLVFSVESSFQGFLGGFRPSIVSLKIVKWQVDLEALDSFTGLKNQSTSSRGLHKRILNPVLANYTYLPPCWVSLPPEQNVYTFVGVDLPMDSRRSKARFGLKAQPCALTQEKKQSSWRQRSLCRESLSLKLRDTSFQPQHSYTVDVSNISSVAPSGTKKSRVITFWDYEKWQPNNETTKAQIRSIRFTQKEVSPELQGPRIILLSELGLRGVLSQSKS